MNAAYYYLAIAICSEVIATVSMKAIKGFSTPIPLLLVIVGYGVAFWMLTLVVRTVLVPAIVRVLGEHFWWPRKVDHAGRHRADSDSDDVGGAAVDPTSTDRASVVL